MSTTVRILSFCLVAVLVPACGGGGGGGGTAPPIDPNPPDPGFMNGAILPPDIAYTSATTNFADADGNAYTTEAFEGQVVVLFNTSTPESQATALIAAQGGSILAKIPSIGLYLASVAVGSEMSFITTIRSEPSVLVAMLNERTTQMQSQYQPQELPAWTAGEKVYLDRIRAMEGWYLAENNYQDVLAPGNVALSIVDVDFNNPSLAQRIDDISDHAIVKRRAFLQPSEHGFDVATLAGATGNNSDKPIGINWHCPLRLISVYYRDWSAWLGFGTVDVATILAQEIGEAGADVVNLSLGFTRPTNNGFFEPQDDYKMRQHFIFLRALVSNILVNYPSKRFLVVAAAGNDATPMNWITLPHDNILVVGAATEAYLRAPYSNYGYLVDLYVPGSDQFGRFPTFLTDGTTAAQGGTSFAAPIASGLASLILQIDPSLTARQLKDRIIRNCKKVSGSFNALDVYGAVSDIAPGPIVAPAWSNSYTVGATGSKFHSIHQTSDGGSIVAGENNPLAGRSNALAMKLNSDGGILWQKQYGLDSTGTKFNVIQRTLDGDYVAAGSFVGSQWVVKLRSDGTVSWQKSYGTGGEVKDIKQTRDGGFILAATKGGNPWIVKLNSDSTIAWQKLLSSGFVSYVVQTVDGGFVVAGSTSEGAGDLDGWLFKLDKDGALVWQKSYGSTYRDQFISVQQTSDAGLIVVGQSYVSASLADGLAIKLAADGSVIWQRRYDYTSYEIFNSICQTSNGDYLAAGYFADGTIFKLAGDGSILWQRRYGSSVSNLFSVLETYDAATITAGVFSGSSWVIKTGQDGSCAPISLDRGAASSIASLVTGITSATTSDTSVIAADTSANVSDTNATVQQLAP